MHATTVTSGDARIRSSTYAAWFWLPSRLMFGLTRPRQRIPGAELAGVVEATGAQVTRFSAGQRVFGQRWVLGFGGTLAEYVCLPEDGMVAGIPRGISFEQAAALPTGGLTALQFLRRARSGRSSIAATRWRKPPPPTRTSTRVASGATWCSPSDDQCISCADVCRPAAQGTSVTGPLIRDVVAA